MVRGGGEERLTVTDFVTYRVNHVANLINKSENSRGIRQIVRLGKEILDSNHQANLKSGTHSA